MSLFTTYLETEIKKRNKIIPTPKGFKQKYTGGNIYAYEGKLSNGKLVCLYGANDLGENEKLPVVEKGDANLAVLYKSKQDFDDNVYSAEKTFKTAEELQAILDKWSK